MIVDAWHLLIIGSSQFRKELQHLEEGIGKHFLGIPGKTAKFDQMYPTYTDLTVTEAVSLLMTLLNRKDGIKMPGE